MKRFLPLLITLLSFSLVGNAQINSGDIVVIYSFPETTSGGTSQDRIGLFLLADLPMGSTFNISEDGTADCTTLETDEGALTFTAQSNLTAGTVIDITVTSNSPSSTPPGVSNLSGTFAMSTAGDQVIIFTGTSASPTFIYSAFFDGTSWDATCSGNCSSSSSVEPCSGETFAFGASPSGEYDNSAYNGPTTFADAAAALAAINDPTNWTGDDTPGPIESIANNLMTSLTIGAGCAGTSGITIPPAGANATVTSSAASSCDDGGWTYYENPSSPGDYVFAINWEVDGSLSAMNATAKSNAQVVVDVLATRVGNSDASGASFVLPRHWNVNSAGTFDEAVNIKFYYIASEASSVTTEASNYATANGLTDNGLVWFKQNGAYDPSTDNAANFQPDVELAVASSGTDNGVPFVQFDGLTSFSGGGAAAGAGGGLPVELTFFTGRNTNLGNELTWSTASQEAFSHFEIERSGNGADFISIDNIHGTANTLEVSNYSLMDRIPLTGRNYYRLKMVDLDGTYEYSNVVVLSTNKNDNIISVYPNPAKDLLTVSFVQSTQSELTYQITNMDGLMVTTGALNADQPVIDIQTLPVGIYIISVISESGNQSVRFVKQ